jgi:hypothetical protein
MSVAFVREESAEAAQEMSGRFPRTEERDDIYAAMAQLRPGTVAASRPVIFRRI